jgi:hypothetical protein
MIVQELFRIKQNNFTYQISLYCILLFARVCGGEEPGDREYRNGASEMLSLVMAVAVLIKKTQL